MYGPLPSMAPQNTGEACYLVYENSLLGTLKTLKCKIFRFLNVCLYSENVAVKKYHIFYHMSAYASF